MENTEKLLSAVSEKLESFEASQKEAKETGELFNIFSITKIERCEENTHSAMVAELLNPQGSHGQNDKFLIEFLKVVMPEPECPFTETKKARVLTEQSFIGLGKVDILIVLDNHAFIIENKIDALDGEKQLQRYKEILNTYFKGKKGHLIYLTKYGSAAEKYSLGTVKDDEYQRISYKKHILTWLDSCIETLKTPPTVEKVEYALKQYQDLIKKITEQSMTHELNKELKNGLVEILIEGNNLKYAQKISNLIQDAKGTILFNFLNEFAKLDSATVITNESLSEELKKLTYNETKCRNWFGSGSKKSHNIGLFFDIEIPNFLFRIDLASQAMYYGIVPVENNEGKYEPAHNLEEFTSDYFEKKNWERLKWFAISMANAIQVWNDIGLIRGDNAQNFIDKVQNSIDYLRKTAEIKVDE
jgi:hypothetical protein